MSSPKVWGKYFWTCFHYVALGYPDEPTVSDRQIYRDFYSTFGHVLPCKKCTDNYERHLQELPIDSYLKNSYTLFEWTVRVHNIVNKELGKPIWNIEYAKMYYLHLDQPGGEFTRSYLDKVATQSIIFKIMIVVNIIVVLVAIYLLWK